MRLAIATLLAVLLLGTGSAEAYYYVTYNQAKQATKEYSKETCTHRCLSWVIGQCRRQSPSRFSCAMGHWFRYGRYGPEFLCTKVLHWGVTDGYLALKASGRVYCGK